MRFKPIRGLLFVTRGLLCLRLMASGCRRLATKGALASLGTRGRLGSRLRFGRCVVVFWGRITGLDLLDRCSVFGIGFSSNWRRPGRWIIVSAVVCDWLESGVVVILSSKSWD
jgi:hypothetical protein